MALAPAEPDIVRWGQRVLTEVPRAWQQPCLAWELSTGAAGQYPQGGPPVVRAIAARAIAARAIAGGADSTKIARTASFPIRRVTFMSIPSAVAFREFSPQNAFE